MGAQETPGLDWGGERGVKWRDNLDAMEAMLAAVDAPLLDALDLAAPVKVAEIGSGGGATTRAIAARAPEGSHVHGFDISRDLVAAARRRVPIENVTFGVADAATARPTDGPFDRLASRFGVMFFADPLAAFTNLASWLKPGGRFAFAVWAEPRDNPWMMAVRDAAASVTEVPRPDPDAPGPFRYREAAPFMRLLEEAGFAGVDAQGWSGKLPLGGGLPAREAAHFALGAFSMAEPLAHLGEDAVKAAEAHLEATLKRHEQDGVVMMDAAVHIVTGGRRG